MILPGSYASGFAPRDGRPLYPEVWRGCVGAWAPCLGPTGLTLRDWSGRQNNGTLTNMDAGTDWVPSQGRYALDFDGSNDYVRTTGFGPLSTLTHNTAFTVSLWFRSAILTSFRNLAIKRIAGSATAFNMFTSGTGITFSQFDGSTDRTSGVVGSLVTSRWYHAALVSTGSGLIGYLDGVQIGSSTTSLSPSANSDGITLGHDPILGRYFAGNIDDVRVDLMALSQQQIWLLASRRGIGYELAPRRRSVLVAAEFNRRRRLLIGAGV
jgi:hypothetical protein